MVRKAVLMTLCRRRVMRVKSRSEVKSWECVERAVLKAWIDPIRTAVRRTRHQISPNDRGEGM